MICDQTFGFANGAQVLAAGGALLADDSFTSGKRSTQLFGLTACALRLDDISLLTD